MLYVRGEVTLSGLAIGSDGGETPPDTADAAPVAVTAAVLSLAAAVSFTKKAPLSYHAISAARVLSVKAIKPQYAVRKARLITGNTEPRRALSDRISGILARKPALNTKMK